MVVACFILLTICLVCFSRFYFPFPFFVTVLPLIISFTCVQLVSSLCIYSLPIPFSICHSICVSALISLLYSVLVLFIYLLGEYFVTWVNLCFISSSQFCCLASKSTVTANTYTQTIWRHQKLKTLQIIQKKLLQYS